MFFPSRINKKTKPSGRTQKVLTAQGTVLRYAHYQGYSTDPPNGYIATIAIMRTSESLPLCGALESMGWTLYFYAENSTSIDKVAFDAATEHLQPGVGLDHIGCISAMGLENLLRKGIQTSTFIVPSEGNTTLLENRNSIDEILPKKEVEL